MGDLSPTTSVLNELARLQINITEAFRHKRLDDDFLRDRLLALRPDASISLLQRYLSWQWLPHFLRRSSSQHPPRPIPRQLTLGEVVQLLSEIYVGTTSGPLHWSSSITGLSAILTDGERRVIDGHILALEQAFAGLALGSRKEHVAYEALSGLRVQERDYDGWASYLAEQLAGSDWASSDLDKQATTASRLTAYCEKRKRMTDATKKRMQGIGFDAALMHPVEKLFQEESSLYARAFSLWEYLFRTADEQAKANPVKEPQPA